MYMPQLLRQYFRDNSPSHSDFFRLQITQRIPCHAPIQTASIDPQIRNDHQHRKTYDVVWMGIHTGCGMNAHLYHIVDLPPPTKHGHLLNLFTTPVTLCKGWQSGSNIPYHNAQWNMDSLNCALRCVALVTRCACCVVLHRRIRVRSNFGWMCATSVEMGVSDSPKWSVGVI